MADYQTIRVEQADGVVTLTLTKPDKMNAMSREMVGELLAVFDSLPGLGAEQLIVHRIVDRSQAHFALLGIGDRDAVSWHAVCIVDGAIQRVNIPGAARPAAVVAAFFGHDAILRKPAPDLADQKRFRTAVDFGDQIDLALVIDLQALAAPGAQDFPGLQGQVLQVF